MGRPRKLNIDWYQHDVGMRNDLKIRAIRQRYGNEGYAVYNMLLEILGEADCLSIPWDDDQMELLAPDIGVQKALLAEMVEYFCRPRIELFQIENGYLCCRQLEDRCLDLFSARKISLEFIRKKRQGNPQGNTKETHIVEESRVEKRREEYSSQLEDSAIKNHLTTHKAGESRSADAGSFSKEIRIGNQTLDTKFLNYVLLKCGKNHYTVGEILLRARKADDIRGYVLAGIKTRTIFEPSKEETENPSLARTWIEKTLYGEQQ